MKAKRVTFDVDQLTILFYMLATATHATGRSGDRLLPLGDQTLAQFRESGGFKAARKYFRESCSAEHRKLWRMFTAGIGRIAMVARRPAKKRETR